MTSKGNDSGPPEALLSNARHHEQMWRQREEPAFVRRSARAFAFDPTEPVTLHGFREIRRARAYVADDVPFGLAGSSQSPYRTGDPWLLERAFGARTRLSSRVREASKLDVAASSLHVALSGRRWRR